jgi:ParB family transcriptional regulator, chromosome partitioning protein
MMDPTTDTAFRSFAADRKYSQATIERWSHLGSEDAAAVLRLIEELRPSENQLRDLWTWIEEIGARDRVTVAQVLVLETLTAARRRDVGRNDKLKLLKGALRRVRFPQLTAAEDRLAALIRELALPRQVRVVVPECLEGDTIRLEITADNAATLRAAVEALRTAVAAPACEQLFAVLGHAE